MALRLGTLLTPSAPADVPVSGHAGSHIYVGHDMEESGIIHHLGDYTAAIYSSRAPHGEAPNEDAAAAFRLSTGGILLLVADGMGGMPRGEQASALLVDAIHSAMTGMDAASVRAGLIDAIDVASEKIKALGVGAGSTLVAVELNDGILRSCHVGDSMILVVGQRGRIKLQTVSHSPVGYAVEAGLLNEDDALHHDDRNVVSNMVGFADMRIEIGPAVALAPHDTVLLASDGLFDNLYIEEIVACIRCGDLKEAMNELLTACRRRMKRPGNGQPSKPDDLTFILLRRDGRRRAGRKTGN